MRNLILGGKIIISKTLALLKIVHLVFLIIFPDIVGKEGHTPLFFSDSPFLEIQYVPIFYRSIRNTKVLNESFNQLLYKFYPQSILILDEYLLQWWNVILWKMVRKRTIKLRLETATYIATTETVTCIITVEIVIHDYFYCNYV